MATCRSCGAEIQWMETENGKKMPVDPEPLRWGDLKNGDVAVNFHGRTRKKNKHMRENGDWFLSHFATCPNADDHRK